MDKILQIKHWQVFVYLLIVPVFFPESDTGTYLRVIHGALFVAWVIKINEELYDRLPKDIHLNLTLLQLNLLISVIYMVVIFLFTEGYYISSEKDNYAEYGWKLWIYIPLTFYVLFSYFYSIHFTAYSIHVIEKKLFGKSSDYGMLLAALFFFPIGIWFIQPKINRILETQGTEEKTRNPLI